MASEARNQIREREPDGIASSMIARNTNGGTNAIRAARRMESKKPAIDQRYGRAKLPTLRRAALSSRRPFTAEASPGIIM